MRKSYVLLAEDDADQRELFTLMLEEKGFEVHSVANGKEALAELQRSVPDLILTDIQMPEMNGLDLVWQVKHHAKFVDVPIIVMTCNNKEYLKVASTMGANGTIAKPFDEEDLFTAILQVLPESEGH